ncbi:phosphatidylinositol 4-kinase B [Nematocida sp. LUAm3]|nr:phosphatidylinositol 4-kinase B [Nematocida sp. LUAm3]KAI5176385.1 phosphatidylinositol 4-kinase B [Nematocida sp. LUAm2]KAI5179045.1 phosphatidylinositol 4-kinase B [Nematocida sp. LUAm1]
MVQEKRKWLLDVFESEYFMFWMAIKCLFRNPGNSIHQYLCFRILQTRRNEILFHLPQLFHIMLMESGTPRNRPIFRMLYYMAKRERHFALKMSMYALSVSDAFPYSSYNHKICIETVEILAQIERKPLSSPVKRRYSPVSSLYTRYLKMTYGSKVGMSPSTKILLDQQRAFYSIPPKRVYRRSKTKRSINSILAALLSGVLFMQEEQNSFLLESSNVHAEYPVNSKYTMKCAYSMAVALLSQESKEARFISRITEISDGLKSVPKASREQALSTELNLLNLFLPERICLPLLCRGVHSDILRVSVEQSHSLDSATRAPFLLVYESAIGAEVLIRRISAPSPQVYGDDAQESASKEKKEAIIKTALKILSSLKELDTHAQVDLDILGIKTRVIKKIYGISSPPASGKKKVSHKEEWMHVVRKTKESSSYRDMPNWRVNSLIVKSGSDMKQEQLITQILFAIKRIWKEENVSLFLQGYRVMVTGKDSGLIETVTGARSIHQIKRLMKEQGISSLLKYFEIEWKMNLEETKESFFLSLVGYALVSYILQIKDRHNGNILIDSSGRMLHIDFGFVLGTHPGFYSVESAPFKFSVEYAEIVGPERMLRFKEEFLKGYLALRKNMDHIITLVESAISREITPSISVYATDALRERFAPGLTEEEFIRHSEEIVTRGMKSVFTEIYDSFQYYTQGYCR